MSDISTEIARLLHYGVQNGLLQKCDCCYAANRMLALLNLREFTPNEKIPEETLSSPAPILSNILDWAYQNGILEGNTPTYRDILDARLMDCMMPRPSEIIDTFYRLYESNKKSATDYYYNLSCNSNYIHTDRIARNELWTVHTKYGEMIITINLSKPEKDPRAIAAARNTISSGYPKCALCRENEGFAGNLTQAPRSNHRLIPLTLEGETWFMQYSPYVYYNEHCIVLNEKHTPMKVSRASMARLLAFVTLFPHYFIGSNADLPIVGGSILTHDHFQGGNFEFPMAKAGISEPLHFDGFDDVEAGIVNWPMSVIRLSSENKGSLLDLADKILHKWKEYSDPEAKIFAYTNEVPHNTITPIARFRNGKFELDLVLRNNRTSHEYPLGLFHPHPEYHHIKKENIGLIEVMGLAILPARLKVELRKIEEALLHPEMESEIFSDESMRLHLPWYHELKMRHIPPKLLHSVIQEEVGKIFASILGNSGVFKDTSSGKNYFLRFCESVNK